jgi:hypothetical protein
MKFRVVGGTHTDHETGKIHEAGDEIESPHELDVLFTGKFERIGERTKKGRDQTKTFDKDNTLDSNPDRPRTKKNARLLRQEEEEEEATASDAPIKGVGENTGDDDEREAEEDETDGVGTADSGDEDEDTETEEEDDGEDVSDQFSQADKADVKVFKKGNTYRVKDSEGNLIHRRTFHLKKDVTKQIAKHLKSKKE